ncbi:dolichyl pyrophosphate Man9GlcNAc2 alpha-1,3-glucosyltransferase [Daktulosphaira vitifoliae]|uniref:dolichyl pyrophosphate Man9GlcNAc2 alpha-1,3-glucosyltransferase n=1 Tax=Daktulosphaira vitifoliae TaxID=58002 RepID=UPI0021AA15B5|nr:dolichyl pyrophosphate Man9GlcNAc2 alpha-1,3-glucosyltransferase [Daktulosphaira vitifoliae]
MVFAVLKLVMSYNHLLNLYQNRILDNTYVFMIALLFRWLVSIHGYSGKSKPPMYGDYEAQRHWMEITVSLPINQWYFNSSDNDLLYWGLDYPPITAYHSYINGLLFKKILPESVLLNSSRGFESEAHKLLMRCSVLLVDILIFIPAVYCFFNQLFKIKNNKQINKIMAVMLVLLYPGLILIDHGHFQYNCVSLGLFIASVTSLYANKNIFSCVFFCMAISYKQMELYHAVPFFFYYIGIVVESYKKHKLSVALNIFSVLCISVILTFMITWAPFITNPSQLFQVIHRIFPLERGIFEDKVSNVWCIVNIFYKLKNVNKQLIVIICLLSTLVSVLPSCLNLLKYPTKDKFLLSLINCSFSFFLFSFQVHEKSILLVAIPILLYAPYNTFICTWIAIITSFSMLPLYIKDDLMIPFISLSIIYFIFCKKIILLKEENVSKLSKLRNFSLTGCVILTLICLIISPPKKYPYLWPLLISIYSCIHFICFWLYFNYQQLILYIPKKKLY